MSLWLLTLLFTSSLLRAQDTPAPTPSPTPAPEVLPVVIAPVSLDPASVPAAAAADASQSEDTPVVLEEIAGERDLTGSTDWQPADFSKQEQALGWSAEAFKVPLGLERNYQFWLDIYTKYTTDQGVLHDAEAIDCIYEVLDFSHISSRSDLSSFQKAKQKKLAVQNAKKDISEKLKALQKIFEKNPAEEPKDLPPDELKMYQCFKDFPGKKRFADATSRNRLRFQLGQRDRMVQGIFFSGRYLRDFEKDFRDAGLPIELTRLPFVESSYNVLARSKVGASGLWQIMKATSKPYMHRDPAIDMRNYPLAAAHLATKIFKMNYELLESWPLAVTGYNHGPAGVKRLTQLYKTRDLSELARSHSSRKKLGFASRNFYVSFLAALEAERNAPKYFGPILWSKSLDCQEITLTKPVTWAEVVAWYDGNEKIAQIYNPHITALGKARGHKIPKGVLMMIPKAKPELKSKYAE